MNQLTQRISIQPLAPMLPALPRLFDQPCILEPESDSAKAQHHSDLFNASEPIDHIQEVHFLERRLFF